MSIATEGAMKVTAEFLDTKSKTRGAEHAMCGQCNGGYDKWTYQYVRTSDGVVICPQCLKERNFSDEWDVPTFEEWEKRERKADAEYCLDAGHVIGCPECEGIDEIVELPMVNIGVCNEHKFAWCVEDRVQVIPDQKVFNSSVEDFLKERDHLAWVNFSERPAKVVEEWESKPF